MGLLQRALQKKIRAKMLQRCQHCARILGIELQVLRLCIVPTLLQTSGTSRCYQHVHVGGCIRLCTVSGKVFCRTALETFQWLSITTPRIGSLSLAFSTGFSTLAPVSGKGIWGKKGSIAVTKPFELLVIGLMAILVEIIPSVSSVRSIRKPTPSSFGN